MKKGQRHEAKLKGLLTYFTGQPCKNGHIADRQTSNGMCVVCRCEKHTEWRKNNEEVAKKATKRWEVLNREKHRKTSRAWKQANPHRTAALNAKRESARIQRCPKWLTDDDRWLIDEIYHLSALRTKMTGIEWHVDHIIPLQGKLVSGLHVPLNLRVVTAYENESKGNRYVCGF